jgi:hypothetical protein
MRPGIRILLIPPIETPPRRGSTGAHQQHQTRRLQMPNGSRSAQHRCVRVPLVNPIWSLVSDRALACRCVCCCCRPRGMHLPPVRSRRALLLFWFDGSTPHGTAAAKSEWARRRWMMDREGGGGSGDGYGQDAPTRSIGTPAVPCLRWRCRVL